MINKIDFPNECNMYLKLCVIFNIVPSISQRNINKTISYSELKYYGELYDEHLKRLFTKSTKLVNVKFVETSRHIFVHEALSALTYCKICVVRLLL